MDKHGVKPLKPFRKYFKIEETLNEDKMLILSSDRKVTQRFDQPRWTRKEFTPSNQSNGIRREIIQ